MANARLDSWKAIASYFGRGLRTVQRWHVDYAMPVHHLGGAKGSVYAYTEDLDKWLAEDMGGPRTSKGTEYPEIEARKLRSCELTACADRMWTVRSERNLPSIAALYREAIDEDPENSAALIGLSRSLITQKLLGVIDGAVAYPVAKEALRYGSHSNAAKSTLAFLNVVYERRWRQARADLDAVLEQAPEDAYALAGRALLHLAEGNTSEAFRCAFDAWNVNPLAATLLYLLCWIEYLGGNFDAALKLASDAVASGTRSAFIAEVEALVWTATGDPSSNIKRIKEISAEYPHNWMLKAILGHNYAACGQAEKAREILSEIWRLREGRRRGLGYSLALVLIGLERPKEAVAWLESEFKEGSIWSMGFKCDPLLQPLRGDPHFESLLRKIGPAAELPLITCPRMPELYNLSAAAIKPAGSSGDNSQAGTNSA